MNFKLEFHYFQLQSKGIQIPGMKSAGLLDFIHWRIIFVD